MASSDYEGESLLYTVSNYHFVDDNNEPISFSELPVQWNESDTLDGREKQIFLHGTTGNGLHKIYKQVTAWKFDLSNSKPEVSVLSKENSWINLEKPRKSFEDAIRTILITLHYLHFVKKNPESSGKALWDHLSKIFKFAYSYPSLDIFYFVCCWHLSHFHAICSSYEARPSQSDLVDHTDLISEAVQSDEALAKSKFLGTILEEKPRKSKSFDEAVGSIVKSGFTVDNDMIDESEEDGSYDEEAAKGGA